MPTVADWPAPVRAALAAYGDVLSVENLGGMSLGQVWRVRVPNGSLIVKTSPSDRELRFYRTLAGPLAELGVATPRLEWSGSLSGSHWLLLEDVPDPLPRPNPWHADRRVLDTLRRLHCAPTDLAHELPGLFRPRWTSETSATALTVFPPGIVASLAPRVESLRRACRPLFEPRCLISGDPNPANWGVRADGTAVLFDWERLAIATPAIDLAIIIPGLGDDAAYRQVARDYLDPGAQDGAMQTLAHQIAIAKAWTVIEFIANHIEGAATDSDAIIEWLIETAPPWLSALANDQL